jgi:8-oxo-dGTP diphosphatase
MTYTIYNTPPKDFTAQLQVSAAFIYADDEILLIKRNANKEEGATWEIPGGKFEEGESKEECVQRELFEETGLKVENPIYLGALYFKKKIQFTFHIFAFLYESKPEISLSQEHSDMLWIDPKNPPVDQLISGGLEVIDFCLQSEIFKNETASLPGRHI